jgi:hypothetical protein
MEDYKMIPSIDSYYFDGQQFVHHPKKTCPVKITLMGALLMGCVLSITPANNYEVEPVHSSDAPLVISVEKKKVVFAEYIKQINPKVKDSDAESLADSVLKWGRHFSLEPTMLLAVAKIESTFDKHAISPVGAMGVLQVLPRWHLDKIKEAKKVVGSPEMFNIEPNVYVGAQVLKDCKTRFKEWSTSLKCYNGSVGMQTTYAVDVLSEKKKLDQILKGARI